MSTGHFGLVNKYPFSRGKVRDLYDLGDRLLIVTTDRLSAFDVVLPTPIPGKGYVLTAMCNHWFTAVSPVLGSLAAGAIQFQHHLLSTSVDDLPPDFRPFEDELRGRIMIVKKCLVLPIEAIVRGFITGSYWAEYLEACATQRGDTIVLHGFKLPRGMLESQEFPEPLFTPSTKAERGEHDLNIDWERMIDIIGA